MASDPTFSEYLLKELPADKDKFLAVLRNNSPGTYLKTLFKIEEKKEETPEEEVKEEA